MTVGELKKALKGLPDKTPVMIASGLGAEDVLELKKEEKVIRRFPTSRSRRIEDLAVILY